MADSISLVAGGQTKTKFPIKKHRRAFKKQTGNISYNIYRIQYYEHNETQEMRSSHMEMKMDPTKWRGVLDPIPWAKYNFYIYIYLKRSGLEWMSKVRGVGAEMDPKGDCTNKYEGEMQTCIQNDTPNHRNNRRRIP